MPKGIARSISERIMEKQKQKAHYQAKIQDYRRRITALKKAEVSLRANKNG